MTEASYFCFMNLYFSKNYHHHFYNNKSFNQYLYYFLFLYQAVIFVIDSTNTERLSEAHDELAKLLAEKRLENALILIYANKQVGGMLQTTLVFFI